MTVTPNLLIHTGNASDGTPTLYAVDKQTGERLASIEVPGESSYGIRRIADPAAGILYVTSRKHCTTRIIAPGAERDAILAEPTGTTIADYAVLSGFGIRGPDGLNIFKPPYSRITAIDMNTGEHLWWMPVCNMRYCLPSCT